MAGDMIDRGAEPRDFQGFTLCAKEPANTCRTNNLGFFS